MGTGVSTGAAGTEPTADADGRREIDARGLGVGVANPTVGVDGLMLESRKPRRTATRTAAIAAPMLMSEAWSVGKGPVGAEALRAATSGTPHDRHTCAQPGLGRPQLKHSTVSPVIDLPRVGPMAPLPRRSRAPQAWCSDAPRVTLACE